MQKLEKLYEGKAKMVFRTDDPELLIVEYKDDATAFNGEKRGTIAGKGVINNRVTNHLMTLLEEQGVPTHFVRELSDRGVYVSSGSACHRGKPSHVFAALGLPKRTLMGVLRVSFSPESTRADVDALAGGLTEITKTRIAAR